MAKILPILRKTLSNQSTDWVSFTVVLLSFLKNISSCFRILFSTCMFWSVSFFCVYIYLHDVLLPYHFDYFVIYSTELKNFFTPLLSVMIFIIMLLISQVSLKKSSACPYNKIDYVSMPLIYVNMQHNYVDM